MSENITISPQRSIGGLDVQCTIREEHTDVVALTRHPVERGADITDHAYREPSSVTIEAGWSNASTDAGGDEGYVLGIYDQLLAFQNPPQLLTLVTGKRTYQNMVLVALGVTTDEESEAALFVTATFQEVIQVFTEVATLPQNSQLQSPQKNGAVQNNGTIQAVPSAVAPAGSTGGG